MKQFSLKFKLFTFLFLFFFSFMGKLNADELKEILDGEWFLGDVNAPITVIEYASMSCPHCASFHLEKLPIIKEEYIDTGKIKFVFRDFPFNIPALQASMIVRCVDKDLYFKYINALFSLQKKWVKSKGSEESLFQILNNSGMSKEEFDSCLGNKEVEKNILLRQLEAQKEFNIRTTPSFVINGKLLEGNKSIDVFRKIFDSILSKSI